MSGFRMKIDGYSMLESLPPTLQIDVTRAHPGISLAPHTLKINGTKIEVHMTTRDSGGIHATVLEKDKVLVPMPESVAQGGHTVHMFIDGIVEKIWAMP